MQGARGLKASWAAVSAAREFSVIDRAENVLHRGLGHLFAVAEVYLQLKANESFQYLQTPISGMANRSTNRRGFYNESASR